MSSRKRMRTTPTKGSASPAPSGTASEATATSATSVTPSTHDTPTTPIAVPRTTKPQIQRGDDVAANGPSAAAHSRASSVAPSLAASLAESMDNASPRGVPLPESVNKRKSWYGSWRVPKAVPSTQLATESIMGGTSKPPATPDLKRFEKRDLRAVADEAYDAAIRRKSSLLSAGLVQADGAALDKAAVGDSNPALAPVTPTQPTPTTPTTPEDTTHPSTAPPDGGATVRREGWLSWLAKNGKQQEAKGTDAAPDRAGLSTSHVPQHGEADSTVSEQTAVEASDSGSAVVVTAPDSRPTSSSGMWSYLWPGTLRGSAAAAAAAAARVAAPQTTNTSTKQQEAQDAVMEDAPTAPVSVPESASPAPATATASVGSTWAFWSRDSQRTTGKTPRSAVEAGEIAVIGERSEAHPKPAAGIKVRDQSTTSSKASSIKDVPIKDAGGKETKDHRDNAKTKRSRPGSMEIDDDVASVSPPVLSPSAQAPQTPLPKGGESSSTAKGAATAAQPPNLLLPSFRSTYRYKESPSILRQVTQLLLRLQPQQRGSTPAPAAWSSNGNHLYLAKEPRKVRKAVAIGVHGLFPAAYLRPMIGQPTGTSLRFANHGAEAVRRWADSHGCGDCEIEKIALEGEGRVADRVENLWKLLLNWIDHIRAADLVVLACHSQGVPVGFMLLAKLIDMGVVTTARIGVCAMAGVSLGPFPDYKSGLGILMNSATELWDFGNPESEVSKRYEKAVRTALNYGVRVAFIGSLDDQVVPLESAVFSPLHHPYVYRAVFVDGRIHAPDFIAHLIGIACKLRNLGVSDHGLIRELSVSLAGSLYSGEGHSRLYDDPQVYDLAVAHALETADVGPAVCDIKKHDSLAKGLANPNPYHLPWVMRGLLEEDVVKTELHDETAELVRQFDDWKPTTKALKDVKYRLEAVRSKL